MEGSDRNPHERQSEEELRRVFPELEGQLYRRALTLTNHDHSRASDLVHSTFDRALRRIHRYQPGTNLAAWLYRMLSNLHFTQLRHEKTERQWVSSEAAIDPGNSGTNVPSQESATLRAQRSRLVEKLPENLRKIVSMLSAGASFEEISAELHISPQVARDLGHEAH